MTTTKDKMSTTKDKMSTIEVYDAETNNVIGTTDDPSLVIASRDAGDTGIVLACRVQPRGPWRHVPEQDRAMHDRWGHDVRLVYLASLSHGRT